MISFTLYLLSYFSTFPIKFPLSFILYNSIYSFHLPLLYDCPFYSLFSFLNSFILIHHLKLSIYYILNIILNQKNRPKEILLFLPYLLNHLLILNLLFSNSIKSSIKANIPKLFQSKKPNYLQLNLSLFPLYCEI
jgi:hypothetical protein